MTDPVLLDKEHQDKLVREIANDVSRYLSQLVNHLTYGGPYRETRIEEAIRKGTEAALKRK